MDKDLIRSMRYFIIDGARIGVGLNKVFDFNIPIDSLYRGRKEEVISDVAPYLTDCSSNKEYFEWLYKDGWGMSWGIFVDCSAQINELWEHFQNFIIVRDEDGRNLFFRFYDPRVLREFLPTCSRNQIIDIFGPVERFIMEDKSGEKVLIFSHEDGVLIKKNQSSQLKDEDLAVKEIVEDKAAGDIQQDDIDLIV